MNCKSLPSRASSGFTLIELLTVIAIIGILAAIIIPTVGRVRESARSTVCKSNLRQIGLAVQLYANERGFYPPSQAGGSNPSGEKSGQVWAQFLRPYVNSNGDTTDVSKGMKSDIAVCPSRTIAPAAGEDLRITYSAHPRVMPNENDIGSGSSTKKLLRAGSIQRASQIILIADAAQQSHGGAYSNFHSVSDADSTTTNAENGDIPIATANDVDPATGGYFRYRHGGETLNAVFVDGHVSAFKKGEILRRNVQIFY